jgi:cobalamin synthase
VELIATTTWPDVGVALVVALPGLAAAIIGYLNRRQIRTPSGDTLGAVAERTHDITHITSMGVTQLIKENGHAGKPTPQEET